MVGQFSTPIDSLPPIVVAIIRKIRYTPDINPLHHLLAWPITNPDTAYGAIAAALH